MGQYRRKIIYFFSTFMCFFLAMLMGSFTEYIKLPVIASAYEEYDNFVVKNPTITGGSLENTLDPETARNSISDSLLQVPDSNAATPDISDPVIGVPSSASSPSQDSSAPKDTETPTPSPTLTSTPTPTDTPTPTPTATFTPTPTPTDTPTPTPVYYETGIALANVVSTLNIRSVPSSDNDNTVIGKLYKTSYGYVLEDLGDWLKIKTGSMEEAYVFKEYISTGYEAAVYIDEQKACTGTVTEKKVNIRSGPGTDYPKIGNAAGLGDKFTILLSESTDEWFCVLLSNGEKGYMYSAYFTLSFDYDPGFTIKEIEDRKLENRIKNALAKSQIFSVPETWRSKMELTEDEIYLFATVVQTEAGDQSYAGMLAVANVIRNRMENGHWGSTLKEVLFAPGQFAGAANWIIEREQKRGIKEVSYKAVYECLEGHNNIGDFMFFQTIGSAYRYQYGAYAVLEYTTCYFLGDHIFYKRNW